MQDANLPKKTVSSGQEILIATLTDVLPPVVTAVTEYLKKNYYDHFLSFLVYDDSNVRHDFGDVRNKKGKKCSPTTKLLIRNFKHVMQLVIMALVKTLTITENQ